MIQRNFKEYRRVNQIPKMLKYRKTLNAIII